ncbi:MAG: hypothetical protein EA417_02745 [Gammaproteobacteria bacterium]|nr:MAG: hypothetical protein EA417_02745 [Gammaproteobacteria bacterium]
MTEHELPDQADSTVDRPLWRATERVNPVSGTPRRNPRDPRAHASEQCESGREGRQQGEAGIHRQNDGERAEERHQLADQGAEPAQGVVEGRAQSDVWNEDIGED